MALSVKAGALEAFSGEFCFFPGGFHLFPSRFHLWQIGVATVLPAPSAKWHRTTATSHEHPGRLLASRATVVLLFTSHHGPYAVAGRAGSSRNGSPTPTSYRRVILTIERN